ncbi:MAG: trypsin-like peptidase domain-containing protein [Planctomycetota bacterium]|nr:trypsin-like peptidase domain-containing protein [Planctomycetota bacterium]
MRILKFALVPLACLAVAACAGGPLLAETPKAPSPAPAAAPAAPSALDAAKAVETAIERAAEKAGPAVVNIVVMREAAADMLGPDEDGPDAPPDGLRDFLDKLRQRGHPSFRAQGNGSGVIITPDGMILTSEHVVHDAAEIEVTLSTRKKFRAKVVGGDARRDLAVIRIEAKDLPAATLGDAAILRRGQFVLAVGSPFGFGRDGQASISFGIISGIGRAIPGIGRELDRYYGNLIQTDAAVNPGNSGGPLVNLEGEVVGINAVISSQTGASDGVGFAVPITAETKRIIDRLKKGEEIAYGYVGIEIQEVTEEEAKATGAEVGQGAFVGRVMPDAPGAKAGVKTGDVVIAVADRPVRDPDDVIQFVQATPVGEKIPLTVLRKGKKITLTVEVARRPAPKDVLATRSILGEWWRGMRVEPLTPELRTQTGLKETDKGVFVREVRDGSPAAQAELIPGMVINQVGEKKVATIKEFDDAIADVQGPVMVHILGIGVKVIQPPGAGDGKAPADRPKGKRSKKPAETKPPEIKSGDKPIESKPPEVKPEAKPESGDKDKPAGGKKDGETKP